MGSEDGLTSSLLGSSRPKSRKLFATSTSTILAVLLVLLAVFTKYTEKHQSDDDVQRFYTWYLHVGFYAAISHANLYTALSMQGLVSCDVKFASWTRHASFFSRSVCIRTCASVPAPYFSQAAKAQRHHCPSGAVFGCRLQS